MGKTIVVDDSASMRQVVGMALVAVMRLLRPATAGCAKQLGGQKVHLVISDVDMPNMDGIITFVEMKRLPPTNLYR